LAGIKNGDWQSNMVREIFFKTLTLLISGLSPPRRHFRPTLRPGKHADIHSHEIHQDRRQLFNRTQMIDSQAAVFRGAVIALSDIKENNNRIGEPVSIRIDSTP
jgi:hypothetical protein